MFSPSWFLEACKIFIREPGLIPSAFRGPDSLYSQITLRDSKFNPPEFCRLHGFTFHLDSNDHGVSAAIARRGVYEPSTLEVIKREVRKGMTTVDVGANLGWYSLHLSRLVGDSGRVVAFEPDQRNFLLLSRNISSNGIKNVTAIQNIVSDYEGMRQLYLSSHSGEHSIVRKSERSAYCASTTIDRYALETDLRHVDLMRIDAEGSEPLVIRGASRVIVECLPAIVMEFQPCLWPEAERDLRIFQNELEKYTIYIIINSPFLIKRVTRSHLFALTEKNPSVMTNLLLVPKQRSRLR
jgi:FkbM family methyltransferase